MNANQKAAQAQLDGLNTEYQKALYAQPRDERKCLDIAQQMLEVVKGTRLEQAQRMIIERHERAIAQEVN